MMDKVSQGIFQKLYDLHDLYDESPEHMICAHAADHIKKLSEELERLNGSMQKSATEVNQLKVKYSALKAQYDEINRYNIACTKKIDALLVERLVARENKPITVLMCQDCINSEPFNGQLICSRYGGIWGRNDGCTQGSRKSERKE